MRAIGFSTGALFRSDLDRGAAAAVELKTVAIELSALRVRELEGLRRFIGHTDLSAFNYVSLHAPTDFSADQEKEVAETLQNLAEEHKCFVVVHPDSMHNRDLWKPLGGWLCIENMDKRKPTGRTVDELEEVFSCFPLARMCFDIAHAHQIDTTMTEAYRILRRFSERICQLHVSEVSSDSKHQRISDATLHAFLSVANMLPQGVPAILESPVDLKNAMSEIKQAERIFEPQVKRSAIA